jgi:hypothetical protein
MKILRNILAIVIGLLIGNIVNGSIIMISPSVIPPPPGADFMTEEGLKAAMSMMEPRHFLMPWLAHALGTFTGALVAVLIAASYQKTFAYVIAGLFMLGGIYMVIILPSPLWFTLVDLGLAYFPMAFIAVKLGARK